MSSSKNPNELYQKASNGDDTIQFWGTVPKSYQEAVKIAKKRYSKGDRRSTGSNDIEQLKQFLREYHDDMGIYTEKVEENLQKLDVGSILVGQQPVLLGGPGFIGNKLSCLILLHDLFGKEDLDLAPIFFIGDYDGLQKELARQYFPNPISHNAFIIDSGDYLPEESEIAAHAAEVPPYSWLDENLKKLEENLNGFKSQVKGDKKKLLEERWNHIKTILRTTQQNSNTLSEWSTQIWGTITNIINDFGVVYLPTSHPGIRKLVARDYIHFIEKNQIYTEVFQKSTDHLQELGYQPSLPHRHHDYAPFTLECVDDYNRITTAIVDNDGEKFAEGKCPECKRYYSYNVSTADNLGQIADLIGPRVDTSQAVFQDLMNIRIRISGPGEIAYYAQVAKAVEAIGFNLPIFIKYKRAFYNSPWIEGQAKQLISRNQGGLQQGNLFGILRKRTEGIKNDDTTEIQTAEQEMVDFIDEQFNKLVGIDSIDSNKYLGWQFGRFTPQKWGQEVSWIWFDMTLQTGLHDYIQSYLRMYTPKSSLGGYFFINSLL